MKEGDHPRQATPWTGTRFVWAVVSLAITALCGWWLVFSTLHPEEVGGVFGLWFGRIGTCLLLPVSITAFVQTLTGKLPPPDEPCEEDSQEW